MDVQTRHDISRMAKATGQVTIILQTVHTKTNTIRIACYLCGRRASW